LVALLLQEKISYKNSGVFTAIWGKKVKAMTITMAMTISIYTIMSKSITFKNF
jgi:hypothetical protein